LKRNISSNKEEHDNLGFIGRFGAALLKEYRSALIFEVVTGKIKVR
jgi:hypothetical protein